MEYRPGDITSQIIQDEYHIWKRNVPFMYDSLFTHLLEWPSLTIECFPSTFAKTKPKVPNLNESSVSKRGRGKRGRGKKFRNNEAESDIGEKKKVATEGTGDIGETNSHAAHFDNDCFDEFSVKTSSLLLGTHSKGIASHNSVVLFDYNSVSSNTRLSGHCYDNQNADYGGLMTKHRIDQKVKNILHEGEVNRARYMPQDPNIIATKAPTSDVFIFNQTLFSDVPGKHDVCDPDFWLKGHTKEGYGLSWNRKTSGQLLSSADDYLICLFDITVGAINSTYSNKKKYSQNGSGTGKWIDAVCSFTHDSIVEDCAWHQNHPYLFGSVDDNGYLFIWDSRENGRTPKMKVLAHNEEVNSLDFNYKNDFLVCTGSCDKTVALWDLRFITRKLHTFDAHTDDVYQVQWSPHSETMLGSASRRLNVWDIGKINSKQSPQEKEDGPPELVFIHAGHTAKISDFCWSKEDPLLICSVAEDSVLQCWEMVLLLVVISRCSSLFVIVVCRGCSSWLLVVVVGRGCWSWLLVVVVGCGWSSWLVVVVGRACWSCLLVDRACWSCLLVVLVGRACWLCLLVVLVGRACWSCLLTTSWLLVVVVGRGCWSCLLVVLVGRACWSCLLVVLVVASNIFVD